MIPSLDPRRLEAAASLLFDLAYDSEVALSRR